MHYYECRGIVKGIMVRNGDTIVVNIIVNDFHVHHLQASFNSGQNWSFIEVYASQREDVHQVIKFGATHKKTLAHVG